MRYRVQGKSAYDRKRDALWLLLALQNNKQDLQVVRYKGKYVVCASTHKTVLEAQQERDLLSSLGYCNFEVVEID